MSGESTRDIFEKLIDYQMSGENRYNPEVNPSFDKLIADQEIFVTEKMKAYKARLREPATPELLAKQEYAIKDEYEKTEADKFLEHEKKRLMAIYDGKELKEDKKDITEKAVDDAVQGLLLFQNPLSTAWDSITKNFKEHLLDTDQAQKIMGAMKFFIKHPPKKFDGDSISQAWNAATHEYDLTKDLSNLMRAKDFNTDLLKGIYQDAVEGKIPPAHAPAPVVKPTEPTEDEKQAAEAEKQRFEAEKNGLLTVTDGSDPLKIKMKFHSSEKGDYIVFAKKGENDQLIVTDIFDARYVANDYSIKKGGHDILDDKTALESNGNDIVLGELKPGVTPTPDMVTKVRAKLP